MDIYDHQKNKITKLDDDENTAILVIESTPFYAEGGGQQSDKGIILNKSFQFQVDHVQMINNTILHIGSLISGEIKVGDEIQSKVEEDIRKSTAINHSATHLLHNSLREILGEDVQQRGSSVTDKRLTFDFTYEKALTKSQITSIENDIAKEIDIDIQTVTEELKY